MRRTRRLSWRSRLSLLLLVFAVLPVLLVATWTFRLLTNTFEAASLESLQALARSKAEAIDQFMDNRRRDVERISTLLAPHLSRLQEAELSVKGEGPLAEGLPQLQDAEALNVNESASSAVSAESTAEARAQGQEGTHAVVGRQAGSVTEKTKRPSRASGPKDSAGTGRERLEQAVAGLKQTLGLILWDQQQFEELLVMDSAGRVVAATFEGHEGTDASMLAYFEGGRRATFVQPVFKSPITGQLTMIISTPIRTDSSKELGVLAARLNLGRFFRLVNDAKGLGETGETLVARKMADQLVFMAPTRHDPEAALTRTLPLMTAHSKSLQSAALGQMGAGSHEDYRGVLTLAAWQFVPSVEWGLVVKMDYEEALAGVLSAQRQTFLILGVVLLLVIPAGLMAAGSLMRPLRELQRATDRISRGDFGVELQIDSGDEIGDLADSFERMIAAIKFFREHSRGPDDDEEEALRSSQGA